MANKDKTVNEPPTRDPGPPATPELKDRALASTAEGITIADAKLDDRPLIYVNAAFEQMTGYSAQETLGRNCRFLQGEGTDPEAVRRIREAIDEGRACVEDLLNYRKDGTPFWNRLSITPVQASDGSVGHFIGVQSDITDRRRMEDALREAKERLEESNRRMTADLEAAAGIQQSLLPRDVTLPEGIRASWELAPCDELAGDMLGLLPLRPDTVAFYVVDVSGHGVPAALLSVTLHHWFTPEHGHVLLGDSLQEPHERQVVDPADVARKLNQQFPFDPETAQYFTVVYGVVDLPRRQVRMVSAGHPCPFLQRGDGTVEPVAVEGAAVGFLPGARYEEQVLQLAAGDRLFLYSDGLLELADAHGEHFGARRLRQALARRSGVDLDQAIRETVAEARTWGEEPLEDDLSLVGFELS